MDEEFSEFDNQSIRDIMGYVHIYIPKLGYRKRARLVMEKHLGRKLTSKECVHHINKIKHQDNIENLQILSPSEHTRLHSTGRRGKRNKITKATERVIRYLRRR